MDATIRCRLCGSIGTEDGLLLPISEEVSSRIITLFKLHIGGDDDRLSCCVCDGCTQTVNSTWQFFEQIKKVQKELHDALTASEMLPVSTCSQAALVVLINEEHVLDKQSEHEQLEVTGRQKQDEVELKLETLPDIASDCKQNEDGSIRMQRNIQGWESYPWACYECGASVLNHDELREHCSSHHENSIRFVCADCPKVYTKYAMFVAHVRGHRPYLKLCCDVCNRWFASGAALATHRAAQHGKDATIATTTTTSTTEQHACATCGRRCRSASALLAHSRSHLPPELKNRYACDECPKRFGTRPNLLAHKRVHAGARDFACGACGKAFVQKGNLASHLLTHSAARPHACSACGKAFKTAARLRKHAGVHSGHRPHVCAACGRRFRERATLREHERIHTGAMPFACEICGRCFRFRGVLTTHRRQHTGERPYSCAECQHHFANWPNYNKHMQRRHGVNTSVTVRKPPAIPPTGMPQRNPPGVVLATPHLPPPPPPPPTATAEEQFYPTTVATTAVNLY